MRASINQLLPLVLANPFQVNLRACNTALVHWYDVPESAADASLLPLHGRSAGQVGMMKSRGCRTFSAIVVHCTEPCLCVHHYAVAAVRGWQRCSAQPRPAYFSGEGSYMMSSWSSSTSSSGSRSWPSCAGGAIPRDMRLRLTGACGQCPHPSCSRVSTHAWQSP